MAAIQRILFYQLIQLILSNEFISDGIAIVQLNVIMVDSSGVRQIYYCRHSAAHNETVTIGTSVSFISLLLQVSVNATLFTC